MTMLKNLMALAGISACLYAQGLDPAKLLRPATDSWPMYGGDYSGRRYSTLKDINTSNVTSLSQVWSYRLNAGSAAGGGRGVGGLKATPLMVNGVLYFSAPDHAWAIDAHTGKEIWHFAWPSKGGIHIGNRGVAISGNWLYFETPDCNLVSLNIKDGTERWHKPICDLDQMYYGSVAPLIIGNHVIVGVSGDDLDIPGYISSRDPETGDLQWRWDAHPAPGDPEAKTWPTLDAMMHGGGMTWGPTTYDPALNLMYFGTGNPQPVIAGKARKGANLYTECIIALNPDTGKMAWYFQPSPHDTHDWDAIQTPVLFDGTINGQPRKLLAQASRNGWFFVLDRTNGKSIVSTPYTHANWAMGTDAKGQPIPNPAKEPQTDGALVNPNQGGAANWPPPAFNPDTGLFYINATDAWSVYYIYDTEDKPEGWGGNDRGGFSESFLAAIDYKTGKPKWTHPWIGGGRSPLLTTAGNLLFTTGPSQDVVALNATTGQALWHSVIGNAVSNSPITYEMDGKQYLVVGAGDTIYAFAMK
jgi:alcohol dehydrogenase (cytochrome c)